MYSTVIVIRITSTVDCILYPGYRIVVLCTTILYPIYPVSWAGDLGPLFVGLGTSIRGIGAPYTRDWSPIRGIGVGSPAYMVSDPSLAGIRPLYPGAGSAHEGIRPLSRGDRSPGFSSPLQKFRPGNPRYAGFASPVIFYSVACIELGPVAVPAC